MAALSKRRGLNMRAFLRLRDVVVLAIAGYHGLRDPEPVSEAFTTSAVRLNS